MFYSQTHLARKGPLGTVWTAAHLQNRLKKSHYTATNIPQTVVDLPEDARQAPVESVTLPQTLNLEDFDLEDHTLDGEFDNNLRNEEDITLTDQIPTGVDPYVSITFDEDIIPESSPMDVDQSTVPVSGNLGETDVEMAYETERNDEPGDFNVGLDTGTHGPRGDTEEIPESQDPRQSNMTEALNPSPERSNASSPGTVPEIERMRDAAHDFSPPSFAARDFTPPSFAAAQQNTGSLDETLNVKEHTMPDIDEEVLNSRGNSTGELRSGSPFELRSGSPFVLRSGSPFVLRSETPPPPSPPPPPPQPQARPGKRKRFDKVTVLSNRYMRERLEDPSDTVCKRKKMPSSKVKIWRMNNQSKKDQIFNEPLLTGFSDALRSVFEKDCVTSKPHLAVSDETIPQPASVSSPTREAETEVNPTSPIPQSAVPDSTIPDSTVPLSPVQQTEDVQDIANPRSAQAESVATESLPPIERLRAGGCPVYMPSPPPRFSPSRTDDFTTQPRIWETESYRTEPSTSTYPEDRPGRWNSGISPIPGMADEELYFLEVGGDTPVRSPTSQDSDGLTGRTRALAQYLKERSSSSPTSSDHSGDLSLGKILAGKTRKLAARMFFETLVLKSRGLVDVKQEQPYSDIALKLMPALFSKVQS
ncbi:unnamed protein product [Thlaspi arvense]|uniref:Sister chromatid cohesion 1 protein 3 n=1 Tax=Thlaspi arvense TaxID=13288 RepID=A0AAU9SG07_THLAR|nr:unnamed protein product [Thlaspi arvense]